jgi:hypothetical protein
MDLSVARSTEAEEFGSRSCAMDRSLKRAEYKCIGEVEEMW